MKEKPGKSFPTKGQLFVGDLLEVSRKEEVKDTHSGRKSVVES